MEIYYYDSVRELEELMDKDLSKIWFQLQTLVVSALKKSSIDRIKKIQETSNKHLELFRMMNQWVKVKQKGKCLSEYFVKNGYKKIVIYRMSYAGQALVEELKGTEIAIAYGIDKNGASFGMDIDILTIDDDLDKVDAIIVTAITYFDEIEERLSKKIDRNILSLEDIFI